MFNTLSNTSLLGSYTDFAIPNTLVDASNNWLNSVHQSMLSVSKPFNNAALESLTKLLFFVVFYCNEVWIYLLSRYTYNLS